MPKKFNLLVTVCARSGSKGVKGKNIRNLCGKPLIAYTIEQVKEWGKFTRLICSTDSKKISEIASKYGAEVPFLRSKRLADDKASKTDALRHALIHAEKFYGIKFDALLDLDVTAPIRTPQDIENIVKLFKAKLPDCVFSVVRAHRNPYFNMVEEKPDGTVKACKKLRGIVLRRQDAPQVFDMNASMYVYKRNFLLNPENKMPYSKKALVYEMPAHTGFDIDSEFDFRLIEALVKKRIVKI
ncbi:MAG: acylneuraminate cytidylyltransferase family protein [Candidatus Firestonebacteria bacterium]